jgi:uncharacterized metal-binding protein YceD (DUF177 family)
MKILLEDVPEEGLVLDVGLDEAWVGAAVQEAIEGTVETASAHLEIRRIGPGVHVDGRGSATVLCNCDRCLAPVRLCAEGEIDLYYDPFIDLPDARGSLHPDDLDVGFFQGEQLDLADVLTEFFALEAPVRVVCGEAGVERLEKGECKTGALTAGSEGLSEAPFSALKKLKIDD